MSIHTVVQVTAMDEEEAWNQNGLVILRVCDVSLSCQTGSHDLLSHSSPEFKLFLSSTQVCLNATGPDWYFYPQ